MDELAFNRITFYHGEVDPGMARRIVEAYLAHQPRPPEFIETDPVYRKVADLTAMMEKRGRAEWVICRDLKLMVERLIAERDANVSMADNAKALQQSLRQQVYDAETAYMERIQGVLKDYIETGTAGTKVMAMKIVSELRALRSPPP